MFSFLAIVVLLSPVCFVLGTYYGWGLYSWLWMSLILASAPPLAVTILVVAQWIRARFGDLGASPMPGQSEATRPQLQ